MDGDTIMTYSLGNITLNTDTVTLSAMGSDYLNNTVWTTSTDAIWTGSNGLSITDTKPSAKIVLQGENADIDINGESLKETLQAIKDALKIPNRIQQDARLEESFQELKELRETYERLCKEYQEKQRVWDILNKE